MLARTGGVPSSVVQTMPGFVECCCPLCALQSPHPINSDRAHHRFAFHGVKTVHPPAVLESDRLRVDAYLRNRHRLLTVLPLAIGFNILEVEGAAKPFRTPRPVRSPRSRRAARFGVHGAWAPVVWPIFLGRPRRRGCGPSVGSAGSKSRARLP
jgi:hypothetical protein